MNYQSKCEMCFWRKKSHGSRKTGGHAPSTKYLRIGQAENEESVSFIRSFVHFDVEWFPLSVFYLLYFMKLWMHGIKSRIGPIFNDCVCVCTVRTRVAYAPQAYRRRKKSNLIFTFTCFLSFVLEYICCLALCVSECGARPKTLNGMASTMNFHCCC